LKKVLTNPKEYAIIVIQGKGKPTERSTKKIKKKLKKPLDKQLPMCYNKNVKRDTSYRIKTWVVTYHEIGD